MVEILNEPTHQESRSGRPINNGFLFQLYRSRSHLPFCFDAPLYHSTTHGRAHTAIVCMCASLPRNPQARAAVCGAETDPSFFVSDPRVLRRSLTTQTISQRQFKTEVLVFRPKYVIVNNLQKTLHYKQVAARFAKPHSLPKPPFSAQIPFL